MSAEGFYETSFSPQGEVNLIKDKDTAHELANIEATAGRNKALDREQELKRQHESGLTDQERRNVAFYESLIADKYPYAFSREIGTDGKVYFELKKIQDALWLSNHNDSRFILAPDGILQVVPRLDNDLGLRRFSERMESVTTPELMQSVRDGIKRQNVKLNENMQSLNLQLPNSQYAEFISIRILDPFNCDDDFLIHFKDRLLQANVEQKIILEKNIPTLEETLSKF